MNKKKRCCSERVHAPKRVDDGVHFANSNFDVDAAKRAKRYTEEMSINGEPPSVGMECMIVHGYKYRRGFISHIGKDIGCYLSSETGGEFSFLLSDVSFEEIDDRTDEEKKIDDMVKDMPACIYHRSDRIACAKLLIKAGWSKK